MFRGRHVFAVVVLLTILGAGTVRAQVPLPPPPSIPPVALPAATAPLIAVASPTVGPACGTASLLTLLAPSIAEGYLKIPLSKLIDSPTFRAYGNTALYVCGFVPFSLTPAQCQIDRQILDALRGLNPLAAQVVGLFPGGATVDTVLAIEKLLPQGESVAGPLVTELEALLGGCDRSTGAPPVPPESSPLPEAPPAAVTGAVDVAAPASVPAPPPPAVEAPAPVSDDGPPPAIVGAVPAALPAVFETVLRERTGVQWAGIVAGFLLLIGSAAAYLWSRRPA